MNCANHPDLPVAAFCQNCGKPLCTQCVRQVAGVVYCEPCLAARLNPAAASTFVGSAGAMPAVPSPQSARFGAAPSPVLAGFLGCIPGVGAMYNGQFVKAFAHVIIFVVLISISEHLDAVGLLVAAWIFYQIFDAVQTAIARRDGRPLPDPLGLNDLGQRLGMPGGAAYTAPPASIANAFPPEAPAAQAWSGTSAEGFVSGSSATPYNVPQNAPYNVPPVNPGSPPAWGNVAPGEFAASEFHVSDATPPVAPVPYTGRPEPVGAIVLIGVGMLFLLSTLGVFHMDWIGRGWPVLIILLGAGLLFSRVRSTRRAGGGL